MPRRRTVAPLHGVAALSLLLCAFACAPPALTIADEFPKPYDSETDLSAPHMDPAEAAKKFRVPEGFRVDVFAAEPEVMNPIATAWDTRGRLWVAENFTYAERPKRFAADLRDRILILPDADGNGKPDERRVFLDNVEHLTSIEVGLGGVWLMCPPQLLFVPDADGDDKPDGPPVPVLEGFTVPPENFHNFANGLRWGPDGWLYGRVGASAPGIIRRADAPDEYAVPIRGGMWRYHPQTKQFDALCHGTTNPWGHDWDKHGETFFINTVNGHLWHMIPGAHFRRPHTIHGSSLVYEPMEMHADHWHWDIGKDWTDSRKQGGVHDQLGGGHAHVGMTIYGGLQWPEKYRGELFTLNQHGRRMNVERLERHGSGYVGKHEPDMLFASDAWFRGVEVTYGPDGGVYLIDWNDTGECHENTGVHRNSGRIFKVTYGNPKPVPAPDLKKLDGAALWSIAKDSPNEWLARQATREFANRAARDRKSVTQIFDDAFTSQSLRGLWLGEFLLPTDGAVNLDLLKHSDEHMRTWSVRLLVDKLPLDTPTAKVRSTKPLEPTAYAAIVRLAKEDKSGLVRLACASALQRLPVEQRVALADALLSHAEDADDANLPPLVWYGLIPIAEASPEKLATTAAEGKIPRVRQWIARRSTEVLAKNPAAIAALLAATKEKPAEVRYDVVRGVLQGLAGHRKAKAPADWNAYASAMTAAPADVQEALRTIGVVFGDGRALDEVRRLALDGKAGIEQRRAALESLIEAKPDDLRQVCESLLKVRFLNTTALAGLTRFDDPTIGKQLAANYRSFHVSERSAVVEALVSRPSFAGYLLEQVASGTIPRNELSPFQARQIRGFNDPKLSKQLSDVWGELRDSPDDKRQLIAKLKTELTPVTLASAEVSAGRALFVKSCASCHRLFGSGGQIGPDLTGANRKNLDYLLENIVDPSAVVNKDFLMTMFTLNDGRVVSGIVTSENEETLVVQSAQAKLTLLKSDIDERALSKQSLMPEGALQPLSAVQIRNLLAYLMSEVQAPLPPEAGAAPTTTSTSAIEGTPGNKAAGAK
ncbi:MAG: c-type cytochrome [Planctomycetia bacterium]|nr:c-type cytochrome [Planctomycetia bacterium]